MSPVTTQQINADEILVNIGPQHPATHGVLRLVARTDGEVVRKLYPHIGYLHRCAEKIGENVEFNQYIPYTDRMDYLSAANINLGYCLAIEKLCAIEVPERARHIRVILAELNRIASHCIAFGTYALDLGAFTPFFYGFREREMILDIFEKYCGARLTYSCLRIGGGMRDLDMDLIGDIYRFCDHFEETWPEYNTLVSENEIFIKRTANVGAFTAEQAMDWGWTGPCLRGSGVKYDIRKAEPYSDYEYFDFDVPVGEGLKGTQGDCWDRYYVRVLEMMESLKIVRQALDTLPDGPFTGKVKKIIKAPEGEVSMRTESSRGELNFYVVGNGDKLLHRCRARGPSFCNVAPVTELCEDVLLADVMAVVGSLDIVLGEVDR
jgi:NADH-quinone oxidoreductase subunit D